MTAYTPPVDLTWNGTVYPAGIEATIPDSLAIALGLLSSPRVTRATVNASATSVAIVAAESTRLGLAVYNNGSTDLYLAYGTADATTSSFTVKVPTNGLYEAPAGWAGLAVQGIWSGSPTGSAQITEVL